MLAAHAHTRPHRRHSGQTFMEVMIVVLILAVIASIISFLAQNARTRAQIAASSTQMHEISSALELYYSDKNAYPASGTVNAALFGGVGNTYFTGNPTSPGDGDAYTYTLNTAGSPSYYIDDPSTYPAALLTMQMNNTETTDSPSANTGKCTQIGYNPDIGVYCH